MKPLMKKRGYKKFDKIQQLEEGSATSEIRRARWRRCAGRWKATDTFCVYNVKESHTSVLPACHILCNSFYYTWQHHKC